jgi:Rieske Fe-S protein
MSPDLGTGVSRRSALSAVAVVAAGGAAGYVYGRRSDAAKSNSNDGWTFYPPTGARQPLARVADIPEGGGVIASGVVVCRPSGETVRAFSARCTHLGCSVNRVADRKIFCPCHGSVFDATSGAVVQGPASAALSSVRVTVRNGEVFRA